MIRIGGQPVNDLSPAERDVAMVFQSYTLYPHKDVRGNLAFPLEIARLPKPEIDRRIAETAELLEISALLGRRPRDLSGGQRQRVALGRALVRKPRVLGLPGEGLAGVRPEHLEVLTSPAPGAIEGTVELTELTGAELFVTVKVEGAALVARAPADLPARPEARLWLRPAQDRVLRFED